MHSMFFLLQLLLAHTIGTLAVAVSYRQVTSSTHGAIISPLNGAAVAPGETFGFDYTPVNLCESGYNPVSVYLLGQPASDVTLTASGQIAEYLYQFGDYTYANFGLPPMSPPPTGFEMPDLSDTGIANDETTAVYLVVIETYMDCPGGVAEEYGIAGNNLLYGTSS